MADRKVSQLQSHTLPAAEDLLYIVDNPNGTPVSKKITVKNLAGNMPNTSVTNLTVSANVIISGSNSSFTSNVNVTGTTRLGVTKITSNGIVVENSLTPANSTITGVDTGKIFWDANYIYVRVSNTTIKRVALSSF